MKYVPSIGAPLINHSTSGMGMPSPLHSNVADWPTVTFTEVGRMVKDGSARRIK